MKVWTGDKVTHNQTLCFIGAPGKNPWGGGGHAFSQNIKGYTFLGHIAFLFYVVLKVCLDGSHVIPPLPPPHVHLWSVCTFVATIITSWGCRKEVHVWQSDCHLLFRMSNNWQLVFNSIGLSHFLISSAIKC
jgi:hypothetical protein